MKNELRQRERDRKDRLHKQMLNKIAEDNAKDDARRRTRRNWAKECESDNQYVSFLSERTSNRVAQPAEAVEKQKGEVTVPVEGEGRLEIQYHELQKKLPLIKENGP